jgi:phage terminase large subunit
MPSHNKSGAKHPTPARKTTPRPAKAPARKDSVGRKSAVPADDNDTDCVRPVAAHLRFAILDHYLPFPRQSEFHRSTAKYRLFGGAAGPGKTKALLWETIRQATNDPGVDTLLLRRTFPELETSILNYFRRDVPRDLYRSYNDSKHVVTWHNGSTTRFGYCAGENDVYQYQGAEFLFIGIDELTHFTLRQWQFLTSRNRCPAKNTFPNMAGATNPGNIGHAWVKALWVEKRPAPGMEHPEEYDAREFAFIRATLRDNPVYANDESYAKTLRALPRHLRQAFLEGDWDVFAGQYFDSFDTARHVFPAQSVRIEPWWPRWISIDWGFEHPCAVYWHAARPDGVVVTYREFVQNHLSPRMLGAAIAERSVAFGAGAGSMYGAAATFASPQPERIADVFLSPDAFAERTADSSIAEQLGDALAAAGLPRPAPADNDRVGGWMLMYQMLESGHWQISSACSQLIECIPTLTRDAINVEDIRKFDGDDTADSARYGLKSRLDPGRAPADIAAASSIAAEDPTSRAIWMRKFERESAARSRGSVLLPRRWRPR